MNASDAALFAFANAHPVVTLIGFLGFLAFVSGAFRCPRD